MTNLADRAAPVQTDSAAFASLLAEHLAQLGRWRDSWPAYRQDPTLDIPPERVSEVLGQLVERLTDNFPFFHPAYAGQMLKPPHPVALLAHALTQQINPNNHANDGGPATAKMELETVGALAEMFGFNPYLGHLTSSGTIANLEALWVARQLQPGKAIAYSEQAHYTHARMCEVLGVRGVAIAADREGRLDPTELEARLATEEIGTVVVTAGTTSLGAVDPIPAILEICRARGIRVHVDAAYGGFYRLLADLDGALRLEDAEAYRAIAACDSVVVDPHKHGLQPYGCGAVLFRDPAVGRLYQHDSPYTYFTAAALHLGEISLECSRAGAAAAAFWATLQCFPLQPSEGLGPVLRKTRQAAVLWSELIDKSGRLRLVVVPSLDIVCFYPRSPDRRVSSISAMTERIFTAGMADPSNPIYLAKLHIKPDLLPDHADLVWDAPTLTVLRSCLMKPEHLDEVPRLHAQVLALAAE